LVGVKRQVSASLLDGSPQFPGLVSWIDRASYLLLQGQPAARIAVYHPVSSMWIRDSGAKQTTLADAATAATPAALRSRGRGGAVLDDAAEWGRVLQRERRRI
jgi:hypothetical protein